MNSRQLNAARFLGFADAYDKARPACPPQILEIARRIPRLSAADGGGRGVRHRAVYPSVGGGGPGGCGHRA